MRVRFALALGGGSLLAACGGRTVLRVDGGDGGAGSTNTSTSTATSSGVTTSASSTATGAPKAACEELCDLPFCAATVYTDCPGDCKKLQAEGCDAVSEAYMKCLLDTTAETIECLQPSAACLDAFAQLMNCLYPGDCVGVAPCSDTNGACQCDMVCSGHTFSAACTLASSTTCECVTDGALVGTCVEPFLSFDTCNPKSGCCAEFFGSAGGTE